MKPYRKPILCLDFDGVIHSYTTGWQGADTIGDDPVPGAMEFITLAMADFDVQIFSSRSNQKGGIKAMQGWLYRWMKQYMLESLAYSENAAEMRAEIKVYRRIGWPKEKPPATVTIDDRAITFTGEWPDMEALRAFKPWNKKGGS